MKTNDLIKLLQQIDPSGEEECVINKGDPILCVYSMPAYYDGPMLILSRDETSPFYNVIGAHFSRHGIKINIETINIPTLLDCNNDLPITYDDGISNYIKNYVDTTRLEAIALEKHQNIIQDYDHKIEQLENQLEHTRKQKTIAMMNSNNLQHCK